MRTFLLPVTRSSLAFASSVLRFSSDKTQFLICAKSRDLVRPLRAQFPALLAAHEHDAVPDWSQSSDLKEALGSCNGVILATATGQEIFEAQNEWLECERAVAISVPDHFNVTKLSWAGGLVGAHSPSTVGRNHFELEQELLQKVGDNLQVIRAAAGMDAFLHGRLFDMVRARTLSMSVKRGRIAFVHPLDVAETLSALLQQDKLAGGVYNLTGPEALTFQDVATQLTEGIEEEVKYSNFPLWAVQPARWVRGVPGDKIEEEIGIVRALEAGAQGNVDTGLIEKLLGRGPRSFRSFVTENKKAWPRMDPLF